jgi:hypothetical protein
MYGWNEDKTARVSSYDEKFWIDVFEEIRRTLLRGLNATPNFDFVIPGHTTQGLITEIETKQMVSVRTEPLDLGINNPVKKRKPRPEVQTKPGAEAETSEKTTSVEVVQSSVVSDSVVHPSEDLTAVGEEFVLENSVKAVDEMTAIAELNSELISELVGKELAISNSAETVIASRSDE